MLGFFAVVGLAVIGLVVAVAAGAIDPYALLKSAGGERRPDTRPTATEVAATQPAGEAEEPDDYPNRFKGQSLFLSAADARVSGSKARIESTSSGRTTWERGRTVDPSRKIPNARVTGWAAPDDVAEWTFNCPEAGTYVIVFDCVPGYGSYDRPRGLAIGRFTITANDQKLDAEVSVDTSGRYGSSSVYQVGVGKMNLPAGEVRLRVSPTEKQTGLLGLRSIRVNQVTE
jgi:hypothetical protein